MYRISVRAKFSGAHRLRKYRGTCERLHGHNWTVLVQLSGSTLDNSGLLMDFRVLKQKLRAILKEFDHSYLNNLKSFKKIEPTAENIAQYIFSKINKSIKQKNVTVDSVRVYESDDSWAEYTSVASGE